MLSGLLTLAIAVELTQHPVTAGWVHVTYTGPATTWTVRLLPQGGPGEPYWFVKGDTVTVKGRWDHWWFVPFGEHETSIFTAELLKEE